MIRIVFFVSRISSGLSENIPQTASGKNTSAAHIKAAQPTLRIRA